MKYILIYLVFINLFACLLMLFDKRRSISGGRRIRERTLLWCAAVGGSIGAWAGIYLWRHKTRHPKFTFGIPLILLAQCLLVGIYYKSDAFLGMIGLR